jgi:hypothetical protein
MDSQYWLGRNVGTTALHFEAQTDYFLANIGTEGGYFIKDNLRLN